MKRGLLISLRLQQTPPAKSGFFSFVKDVAPILTSIGALIVSGVSVY
jgi:hypothetical protein